jgi:uncharacterized membrane protein YfcA
LATSLLHFINWGYSVSGFGIGVLVGITGVGGGSLMTPLLILLFGIHPATAVGTDLLYASVTKSVGTVIHWRNKTVDWRVVFRLAAGSVPATALTILVLSHFERHGNKPSTLISNVLGIALILTAITIMFRGYVIRYLAARKMILSDDRTRGWTIFTGAVLGVLVSLSSVGAGAIGVSVLLILYPALPTVRIVGTDIAHAVPLTLVAGFGHWLLGDINFMLLGSLLIGSLPGIIIGSQMAPRIPDPILRLVLASTLVLVGSKLLG